MRLSSTYPTTPAAPNPQLVALQGMEGWLNAIEADHSHSSDRRR